MELHGKHLIAGQVVAAGTETFFAYDARSGNQISPPFFEGTPDEVDQALQKADEAANQLRLVTAEQIADFLLAVREEILATGDELIERAGSEAGLDKTRLQGERDRTTNQLKMFAELVKEGSWVDARIDTALPDRKPLPRPDLRRMLQPIGPVGVFGASNFPLAFSVAGGDSAAAWASRNPVIVKGHPAHPGTSEIVAACVARAAAKTGMPSGIFSLIQSTKPEISLALVRHPLTKAIGFTGSLRAGRALFDEAAKRPAPIPVYAEMGSVNPIFVLPDSLKQNAETIADGLFKSVTAGSGQFCTCPGLVFVQEGEGLDQFESNLASKFREAPAGTMLNSAISKGYRERREQFAQQPNVETISKAEDAPSHGATGQPSLFVVNGEDWLDNHILHEEIFGPATVLVRVKPDVDLATMARHLDGSLTASIHATETDLQHAQPLADALTEVAGRVILNGYPTGVEVGNAMNHGGPYPATSDEKFTSVGTASIYRFARPVCYQNFPEPLLPVELRNANPRGIWRLVNGNLTREPVSQ
jgi:2,5-dioxopentanoate dehydrogenase